MRNFLVLFAAWALIACTGCMKQDKACTNLNPSVEEPKILAYALSKGITATKHNSGLYYEVVNPGSGSNPTVNSKVTVAYVGQFLDGKTFDQSASFSYQLAGLIEGWKIGIPLIKKGGKIKLIIPSSLAYGCNDTQGIPGNSVLYFEVDLLDVL